MAATANRAVRIADQILFARRRPWPTLLEDFILREKITHFDHERIEGSFTPADLFWRTTISAI